jgi:Uma2 family endonuclease
MTTLESAVARLTPEELLAIPDNNSMELVDGRIVEKPVSISSSDADGIVYLRLANYALSTGFAKVFPATLGYQCFRHLAEDPDRMRKPDCTVVRMDRIEAMGPVDPGYMPIVPDLAVEVISPNDVAYLVIEKIHEYREAGFPLVWLVDPLDLTVMVYPTPGKQYVLTEDDQISVGPALPGFVCRVADLLPQRR